MRILRYYDELQKYSFFSKISTGAISQVSSCKSLTISPDNSSLCSNKETHFANTKHSSPSFVIDSFEQMPKSSRPPRSELRIEHRSEITPRAHRRKHALALLQNHVTDSTR